MASSSFIQAYSIIRVTRPAARAAIARAAGNQPWIEQAAEFLIFCADRRVDAACRHASAGALEGWTEHRLAAVVDVALVAQNVLLAAESVGLGGVYIGGIRNGPQTVVDQLQIPELVVPVFGLCLGWPAESPAVKPRQPLELILHQDVYRDPDLSAWRTTTGPWPITMPPAATTPVAATGPRPRLRPPRARSGSTCSPGCGGWGSSSAEAAGQLPWSCGERSPSPSTALVAVKLLL